MQRRSTKSLRRMRSGEAVERYIKNKRICNDNVGLAMPIQSVWLNSAETVREGSASSSSNSVFWPAQRQILSPETEDGRCRVEKTTNNNPTATGVCWSQHRTEHTPIQITESEDDILWQARPADDTTSPRENSERARGRGAEWKNIFQ